MMNRGDGQEPIFKADLDRRRFVETPVEAWTKLLSGGVDLFREEFLAAKKRRRNKNPKRVLLGQLLRSLRLFAAISSSLNSRSIRR